MDSPGAVGPASGWGVRWAYPDGRQTDAWGYSEAAARHMVAVAHGSGWEPQAVAVLHASYPGEATVTVEPR